MGARPSPTVKSAKVLSPAHRWCATGGPYAKVTRTIDRPHPHPSCVGARRGAPVADRQVGGSPTMSPVCQPTDLEMAPSGRFSTRRPLRLAGYDYSTLGAYFVTIGTQHRRCILSRIEMHRVCLTPLGEIVESELCRTGETRAGVRIDSFVIMANHVHAIVILDHVGRRPPRLGVVINAFKSAATRRVRACFGRDVAIWQRGYFDRIVRNERELDAIRDYIATNPSRWGEDGHSHGSHRAGRHRLQHLHLAFRRTVGAPRAAHGRPLRHRQPGRLFDPPILCVGARRGAPVADRQVGGRERFYRLAGSYAVPRTRP